MIQALFYKEWIKTRRMVFLSAIIFACIIIYSLINTAQTFRLEGSIQAWSGVILKDVPVLPSFVQWAPFLTALMIAFMQFVPEMNNKRLKLTLHLPRPESRILSVMLCYGITVLAGIFLITYIILTILFSAYYPAEILKLVLWKSLPWFLGGLASYLLAAWICIEPVWRQRIFNTIISVCLLSIFTISAISGAYIPMFVVLIVATIASFTFPFYSAARFKEGWQ